MIRGAVSEDRDATVVIQVESATGVLQSFEAIVDTGFDGFLSLPFKALEALSAKWSGRGRVGLADGSEVECDLYALHVTMDGLRRLVDVDVAETAPMLGMALLDGFILRIDAVVGGDVTITVR